jgi:hypothetical protein
MDLSKRMKVLSPVSGKDGKTFWMRAGVAHGNKDGSINLYLDMLPTNGRLQIRDWDEPERAAGVGGEGLRYPQAGAAPAGNELPF